MQFFRLRLPSVQAPFAVLLAGLLLGAGLLTLSPGFVSDAQAAECGCRKPAQGKLLDQADVVVTGTVAAVDDSVNPAQFTLTLNRIYRGASAIETSTLTVAQDPDCPLTKLEPGAAPWIVGARGEAGGSQLPKVIGCNVTGPSTTARMNIIEQRFGTGVAPVKPTPPAPTLTKVESAGPERFTRLAAPGAAMFVIGLLGFVGVRRLGRNRS